MSDTISIPFHTNQHPGIVAMQELLGEMDLRPMLTDILTDLAGEWVPLTRVPVPEQVVSIIDEGMEHLLNGMGVPVELYNGQSGFHSNSFQPSETARRALEAGLVSVRRPDADEPSGRGEGGSGRGERLHEVHDEGARLLPSHPAASSDTQRRT